MLRFYFYFFCLLLIVSCSKNSNNDSQYLKGKNVLTTKIDGDNRQYIVQLPSNYDPKNKYPTVMMLHGSSGNGEKFWNISG